MKVLLTNINENGLIKFLMVGVLFKIILGIFLGSTLPVNGFILFLNYTIESSFSNPYEFYAQNERTEIFPYPALMLYVMLLPKVLFGWINDSQAFELFLFRLPILLADLTIFFTLSTWLGRHELKKFFFLYWLSPVLIYISYVHGQLDVVPISLLILSLSSIYRGNLISSAIFLGLSLATKTMIILTFPFIFLYLFSNSEPIYRILLFYIVAIFSFLIINAPFLLSSGFFEIVFNNQEQLKIFGASLTLGSVSVFLVPLSILFLLIKGASIKRFNKDLFTMFLGFSFGIILIFVMPSKGWYYWLFPFLFYFFAKSTDRSMALVVFLQIAYFLYFYSAELLEFVSFIDIMNSYFVGLTFTLLQGLLIANCVWVYQFGLSSYTKYKILYSPFMLGVGGNSGAGKSRLASSISNIFNSKNSSIVRGDDMHRWERGNAKWHQFTHLDPKANELHQEIHMLSDLKSGKKIFRREYDHTSGTFLDEKALIPKNLIIYEGLHPFYLNKQRQLFDLKIFISPDQDLLHSWKINRDINQRGKNKQDVINQINSRQKDSELFIESQSKFADVIIKPRSISSLQGETKEIEYQLLIPNSIWIDQLIQELQTISTLAVKHGYIDSTNQEILISGEINNKIIARIGDDHIPGLTQMLSAPPIWPDNSYGVVMLLVTYLMFEEANNGK
jgi:uridine kinase